MAQYSYWEDLRTDIRKPRSWLDATNMLLRRVGLIIVWHYDSFDPRAGFYRLHWWPRWCREHVKD